MKCIKLMNNIIIIGAGASGMMAAIWAKKFNPNCKITIFDKNKSFGRKLSITGKGRCNVTNACKVEDLIINTPRNGKFLYSAFNSFSSEDVMGFFERNNVPLKIERGNRVFPTSDKASDIVRTLERLTKNSADFICSRVDKIIVKNNRAIGVTSNGKDFFADAVILSAGGKSYPGTGSNGDSYFLAKSIGHTIVPLEASLVGLESNESFIKSLAGLSLINIGFKLFDSKNKLCFSDMGEMLFTHKGISGPLVLSASAFIKDGLKYFCEIDLKPALDETKLDKRIQRDFSKLLNKNFSNSLTDLLPQALIPVIINQVGIPYDKKVNSITKQERQRLVYTLKHFKVNITQKRPISEAIITRGGISTKEIDPKTMLSRVVKNLYITGEAIDVDAFTGGFNLQIAFSTGYLAGKSAALSNSII